MSRVFVCHASADVALAARVVEWLEATGVRCWVAPRDIPLGHRYPVAIGEALENASALLFLFSAASSGSRDCEGEIEIARHDDLPIVAVRLDETALPSGLRYLLSTRQWLDATDGDEAHWLGALAGALAPMAGIRAPGKASNESGPVGSETRTGTNKANPDKVAFMTAVLERVGEPLEAAGLRGVRRHTRGAYLQARLPAAAGLEAVGGHLLFRATARDATVLLVVNGLPTREENRAALQVIEDRYGTALDSALPSAVTQWTGGTGDSLRAYAASTRPGLGYSAGNVDEVGDWTQQMFLAWSSLLAAHPIADIAAEAAKSLAAPERSPGP